MEFIFWPMDTTEISSSEEQAKLNQFLFLYFQVSSFKFPCPKILVSGSVLCSAFLVSVEVKHATFWFFNPEPRTALGMAGMFLPTLCSQICNLYPLYLISRADHLIDSHWEHVWTMSDAWFLFSAFSVLYPSLMDSTFHFFCKWERNSTHCLSKCEFTE